MTRPRVRSFVIGAVLILMPAAASAQAALAGVVTDPSGAVIPGVTVEAASAALIEKVRSAVSDSAGQYRIIDLPPGTYTVTFSLSGFGTVRREGIELTGNRTATVDADLKVGGVAEAITITGDAPLVDVHSTVRQDVLSGELIAQLPTARNVQNVTILIPGMSVGGTLDVGGLKAGAEVVNFSAHGGRPDDGRLQLDGVTVGGPTGGAGVNAGGGGTSYFQPDVANSAELVVTTSGALGEAESGGPVINVIPRSGGNRNQGSFYASYASDKLQGSNVDDALRTQQASGRLATEALKSQHEVNGAFGGPLRRDRLWFFASARTKETEKDVPMFYNLNAGLPPTSATPATDPSYRYEPDRARRAFSDSRTHAGNIRLTWQATARQKFNIYFDEQNLKDNHRGGGTATTSPEAAATADAYPQHLVQVGWQAPWTAKLLFDATFSASTYDYGGRERDGNLTRDLVRITDIGSQGGVTGVTYRSMNWNENHAFIPRWKGAAAYVTGSHNVKVGVQGFVQDQDNRNFTNSNDVTYTFLNGVPSSFTMWGANPIRYRSRVVSNALYVQDQWTIRRVTLQGAARYEYAKSLYPDQTFGGSRWHQAVYDFPTDTTGGVTGFQDVNPRVGVIYDLFGDGKTSLKFNAGRYTDSAASDGRWVLGNPLSRLTTTQTRTWTDSNQNRIPDCDVTNASPHTNLGDSCGPISASFGTATQRFTTTYDPDMFKGWYTRPMDWQLGASVQRQILDGLSMEIGWHRRWADKWTLIESVERSSADFEPYSYTGPVDPRLGPASGRVVGDLWDVIPSKASLNTNFTRLENNVPGVDRRNWWNGGDVNVNARIRGGLTLRGGATVWTSGDDWCSYIEHGYYGTGIPEGPGRRNCNTVSPVRAEYKALGSYTVPRVDVQVAATLTSRPGPPKAANVSVRADVIEQTLGRRPSSATSAASTTVINLFETNEAFYPQISVVDLRLAKVLRLGRLRANLGVDVYNLLNANTGQTYNNTYSLTNPSTWGTPTLILPARFAKVGMQLDF
jgi:hypothetical protein